MTNDLIGFYLILRFGPYVFLALVVLLGYIIGNPWTWLLIGGIWWLVKSIRDVTAEEEAKRRGAEHESPSATSG